MSTADASSSWSGYQYQGKVSLFIVLKLINEFIDDNKSEQISLYSIEIENKEDFAIKKKDEYISFHQVKAKLNDIYLNDYIEPIIKMYEEKDKCKNYEVYLHTCAEIKDWSLEKYKCLLKMKIDRISKEIGNSKNDDCTDKILKLEQFRELYGKPDRFNDINLYDYFGKSYCSLDDIIRFIREQLYQYYKKTNQDGKLGNIEIIYYKLICYLDEYIKERHKKKVDFSIQFTEIKKILDDDNLLKRDKMYHLSILKDKYSCITFYKYCKLICDISGCDKNLNSCNIRSIIEYINNADLHEFEKLLMKFNPHVLVGDWERERSNLDSEKGIYFLYRTIINEMKHKYEIYINSIKYEVNGKVYLPTTIDYIEEYCKPHMIEEYKRNIVNNDVLLRELFEYNTLITRNISSGNILEDFCEANEIDDAKRKEDDTMVSKNYLSNYISFKDISSVKEEIEK